MFYTVSQNNSGGYYIKRSVEAGVDQYICIEADNAEHAKERFEAVREAYGGGFDSACECCGNRWSTYSLYDEDATDKPSAGKNTFVHYADGHIVAGEDVVFEYESDGSDY